MVETLAPGWTVDKGFLPLFSADGAIVIAYAKSYVRNCWASYTDCHLMLLMTPSLPCGESLMCVGGLLLASKLRLGKLGRGLPKP